MKYPDLQLQFRLRDLFLDFLACLVPGFIFLIAITILIAGIILTMGFNIWSAYAQSLPNIPQIFSELMSSYIFNFWISLAIIFLSFIVGHILYRQHPKTPDYASFIRICNKVISEKDDWVVKKGFGVISREVQFPYQNLKNYLDRRGFEHIADQVKWPDKLAQDKEEIQRSKTFINKLKIRISFFFPDRTINIIRNEAHIRLASSVWHATKISISASYYCILVVILLLIFNYFSFEFNPDPTKNAVSNMGFFLTYILDNSKAAFRVSMISSIIVVIIGVISLRLAKAIMKIWDAKYYQPLNNHQKNSFFIRLTKILHIVPELQQSSDENVSKRYCRKILFLFNVYDWVPTISFSLLAICSAIMASCYSKNPEIFVKLIAGYNISAIFLLVGSVFAKHRIERTVHYQRVREVIYVLETANLCKLFDDKLRPNPFDMKPFYDNSNIKEEASHLKY